MSTSRPFDWNTVQAFINRVSNSPVTSGDGYLGFFDTLAACEGSASGYFSIQQAGQFFGLYQEGIGAIDTVDFFQEPGTNGNNFSGIGYGLFGLTEDDYPANFLRSPIAQEAEVVEEMAGCGSPGLSFSSNYAGTQYQISHLKGGVYTANEFKQLLNQTFTFNYVLNGNTVGTSSNVQLTQAAISAAAHLIGQSNLALALQTVWDQCASSPGSGVLDSNRGRRGNCRAKAVVEFFSAG